MFVKNLLMVPASSVAGVFMLIVACSLIVPGSSEIDSLIISTTARNLPKKLSNDINTVDSSNLIKNQIDLKTYTNVTSILDKYFIDLKTHLTVSCVLELENYKNDLETRLIYQQDRQKNVTQNHYDSVIELSLGLIKLNTYLNQQQEKISKVMEDLNKEKEKNQILLDGKTLLDNKLSASLLENKGLNNQLSQLNNTFKKVNQDKEQTLAECSEVNKKYTKSLETLLTCENRVMSLDDHQDILEKNLTTLELKIKNIIDGKIDTKIEMQRIIDNLKLEISSKTQQYSNISLQLENKINENEKIIQESIALKKKQEKTLDEYLGINQKYNKSLETLSTCDNRLLSSHDHQVELKKNLTTLELKIKDIIHEKDHTQVKMQRIIDRLQLEISLKTQQYSNISLQLENKINENEKIIQEKNDTKIKMQHIIDNLQSVIFLKNQQYSNISLELENKVDENNKMIQESIALKNEQAKKLKAIENGYQSNLTNQQQEVKMLKEIFFEISQQDLVESADLLKTLISIMKFNEDNVPDDLLEKRRRLFENQYNENQTIVVNELKKRFDDIASRSNSQFSNKYFCNKKISYYDSSICGCLSRNLNCDEIDMNQRNLSVLPEDIFNDSGKLVYLYLERNRLKFLNSSIFNNLSNLKVLWIQENYLTSLPKDIFTGLQNLRDLMLSNNQLNYLESGIFNDLSNLKDLRLHKNHLTTLPEDIFKGTKKLEFLSLDYNRINYLYSSTFNGLIKLRDLPLHNNNLTTLPHDIFNGLEGLRILRLAFNRLNYLDLDIFNNIPQLNELSINDNNLTNDLKNILKKRYNIKNFILIL